MDADCLIVGGGPAGMMAGLLLARAGVKTLVLEKHADFLRDFRGDTVHPSTLQLFRDLGLLDTLLDRPHNKVTRIGARIAGDFVDLIDLTHLPVPFIALMPQWEFLDFVADAAARYPAFSLRRSVEVVETVEESGRVAGVRTADGEVLRARLVIAADGRHSALRKGADLPSTTVGAPMDVFWFRIPKRVQPDNDSMGVFEAGRIFVLIDRGDYWQCAFVFPKGAAHRIRAGGIAAFRDRVRAIGDETAAVDEAIRSWDDVKLLTVTVDRLERWHRPGLLFIGDAAHAMSPIGGVGINLAIQDAVATANLLAGPMARGENPDPILHRVAKRRLWPTRMTQAMQRAVQDRIIAPLLSAEAKPLRKPPLVARMFGRVPILRRIPARLIGQGFRPERIESPKA